MEGGARSERSSKQSGSGTCWGNVLMSEERATWWSCGVPFVEGCPRPRLDPYTIYPSTVPAVDRENPPLLGFIILNIGVQSRNTL